MGPVRPAELEHGAIAVIQLNQVLVGLPGVGPRGVDADAAPTRSVFPGRVNLVVSSRCWLRCDHLGAPDSPRRHYCIASSISENAFCTASARLISLTVTPSYSEYSRKLSRWCSRTNCLKASGFLIPSSGNP